MSDQTIQSVSDQPAESLPDRKPTRPRKPVTKRTDTGKRSLNLSIPVEIYERLAIHALRQTGGNISELVSKLAVDHLREFHLTRTPQGR